MSQPVLTRISIEEYYYVETMVHSEFRHEFVDGVMLAMTGGSRAHAELCEELSRQFVSQLAHHSCKVYAAEFRIRPLTHDKVFYPDITIACRPLKFDKTDRHGGSLTNPLIIIEVLSPSTMRYDLETKLPAYQSIEGLRTIVYIHQSKQLVETWVNLPSNRWEHVSHESGAFELIGLSGVVLDVDELYRRAEETP